MDSNPVFWFSDDRDTSCSLYIGITATKYYVDVVIIKPDRINHNITYNMYAVYVAVIRLGGRLRPLRVKSLITRDDTRSQQNIHLAADIMCITIRYIRHTQHVVLCTYNYTYHIHYCEWRIELVLLLLHWNVDELNWIQSTAQWEL
jgi:hypothetical protein